jgi:Xaa-Pro aminopeptidase
MLLLAGNTELERTKDVPYPFRQSNSFFYLSGIDQPDAYLVITRSKASLYVKKLHPFMEAWEGRSNHIDVLLQKSGVDEVLEYKDLEELLSQIIDTETRVAYIDTPDSSGAQPAAWQLWRTLQNDYPKLEIASVNEQIDAMRVVKDQSEIAAIEQAIAMTHDALNHVITKLQPGISEQQIAAEFICYAAAQGIEQSFPPVVSFAKNACTIHHTPDSTELKDGDIVLFDVGLEVDGYASDISRTMVFGDAAPRQQQIMQAVSEVQQQSMELMKPGIVFDEFERQSAQIMVKKLVELGLFTSIEQANELEGELQWPAYRRYFNHYTSHFLGLDAHDVGPRDAVFVPGMVLTCEPGIYIAEEGIGVRIEDDILITKEGNRNLSAQFAVDTAPQALVPDHR